MHSLDEKSEKRKPIRIIKNQEVSPSKKPEENTLGSFKQLLNKFNQKIW